MKITYDKSVDAMYIKLNEKLVYKSSKKISDDIMIDYSKDGKVIGLEVLSASKNTILPFSKSLSVPVDSPLKAGKNINFGSSKTTKPLKK